MLSCWRREWMMLSTVWVKNWTDCEGCEAKRAIARVVSTSQYDADYQDTLELADFKNLAELQIATGFENLFRGEAGAGTRLTGSIWKSKGCHFM